MLRKTRSEIMADFRAQTNQGKILVGVGAGTGITAKCSEKADVDMLIIYNSGRFRMAGRGSLSGLLAYGDANAIVQEMGQEVLPIVKKTPVLAGVCGTDPFRVMDIFLKQLKEQGFNGVQNFPTVGLIDGKFRANLEETGMGYGLEVDMIREAHNLDMLTCPYVFDPEQAKAMAQAGADILVAHMGLTTKGSIGAETAVTLDDCCVKIREIITALKGKFFYSLPGHLKFFNLKFSVELGTLSTSIDLITITTLFFVDKIFVSLLAGITSFAILDSGC